MRDYFWGENGLGHVYSWSIPILAAIILAEMIYSHVSETTLYSGKDVAVNMYLAMLNFGLDFIMKAFAMGVMFFFYNHRFFSWNFTLWYGLICFVITDFAYYVLHYIGHHPRAFWAVHITHHSSEYFNLTTGFRSPVLQPLYRYLYFAPLAFLGFNPWHIMVVYAVGQAYGTGYIHRL